MERTEICPQRPFRLTECAFCYNMYITITDPALSAGQEKEERCTVNMVLEIDFNSDEAIYIQLRNQIILGIATNGYREGDVLPLLDYCPQLKLLHHKLLNFLKLHS